MKPLTEITIRGYHVDGFGHVNNARYLEFFEEDRWATLDARIGLSRWLKMGLIFMVVNININYRRPLAPGDIVTVATRLERIGTTSTTLKQEMYLKSDHLLVADAMVTYVIIDADGNPVKVEGELAMELAKLNDDQVT
ncbi:MAG: acyl-CoA thioesterase [Desulfofustis sp. PB-SRB1]|jgi:thioesterase-3|nr:acyl-CoA thioesterase [Desulfofustis sp. PB-SRB1]MBM1001545.1 acyl-CoA thioesterase [Desulfofustis sp. PB-SRB1]